jgi:hypothetical protein
LTLGPRLATFGLGFLEIIQTSIDRPEIGISIQPMEKGQQAAALAFIGQNYEFVRIIGPVDNKTSGYIY